MRLPAPLIRLSLLAALFAVPPTASMAQGDRVNQPPAGAMLMERVEKPRSLSPASKPDGGAANPSVVEPLPNAITATNNYAFGTITTGSLTDMSASTTTLLSPDVDDTASAVTSIGFDFFFQGVRYTQFSVNDNGVLRLGGVAQTATPYKPLAQAGLPIITAYGADQRTHVGDGKVHYKVIGAAPNRVLVVEWLNNQSYFSGTSGTADLTYQVRLAETTGVIEFAYGRMTMGTSGAGSTSSRDPNIGFSSGSTAGTVGSVAAPQSGTPAPTFDGASATPVANLNTAGPITVLSSAANRSRRVFTFAPPTPTAPTNLTFTAVTQGGMTLNWTDSADEQSYAIYRSTDGVNYAFDGIAAQNAISYAVSGLALNTTYFWRVFAVSEGALSTALAGSQATAPPGSVSATATGGNWSATATWTGGVVPTANDSVTIPSGATVTIDTAAAAYSVSVAGILQFEPTTARALVVGTGVTVQGGATLRSSLTGTVTAHGLSLGGSLTNGGTLDLSTNGNAAGAGLTFTGTASATFGGTGATTNVRTITVNKGASSASLLELNPTSFTVRGVTTDTVVGGWLALSNGTLKLSGTFAGTSRVFGLATYSIPATAGFWLNNPNYVVAAQTGNATNAGLLRISQGIFNHGTSAGDAVRSGAGAVFTIEGGTVNCAGQFSPQDAVTYNQSGGTLNVGLVGNTGSDFGTFELYSTSAVFSMTGGTINVVQACTGATQVDFRNRAVVAAVGGTLRVGTGATATKFSFTVSGGLPTFILDGTTNGKTATAAGTVNLFGSTTISAGSTFVINGQSCFIYGPTFTNNGTLTGTAASTRFYFAGGLGATTYAGTGTVTTPLLAFEVDNVAGVTLAPSVNPIVTLRVNDFSGGITGSGKLTVGSGGTTAAVIQLGTSSPTQVVSGFDAPPVFNPGTGGVSLLYAPELTGRATGNEMPPSRTLNLLSISNPNPVTIAGGDVTVNGTAAGALALGAARVITGANTLSFNSAAGTVTRTTGYVDGNFRKSYAGAASKIFEVGTANGYSPVTVNATAGTFPADVTVAAKQGVAPFVSGIPSALARSWTLLAPAGLTASLTFNYLATDVTGNAANYRFFKNVSGTVAVIPPSATPTTTSALLNGATAIAGDWTLAEPVPAIAVADGAAPLTDGASTVDFGSSPVSTGAPRTFTITNPGSASLTLGAITVDGANSADFVASAPGSSTVAPGGSTTFTVTFTPSATGGRGPAAVHLASNVSGAANPFDFFLAGTGLGVAPLIASANSTLFQLNAAGSFQVMASGSPAPTFSATGTPPAGVGFTAGGLLSGTPMVGGTFPLTLTASNGVAPNAAQTFTLTVMRPPVAGADALATRRNTAATVTTARLRANDSDPDGDPTAITSVSGSSSQGGTVALSGNAVTYTPATGFTGADSFTYQLADGRGGFATGTVSVTVTAGDEQPLRTESITMSGGSVTLVYAGVPGYAYQVQYQDTMAGPWTNAGPPITADSTGRVTYTDPNPPASRFYRAIVP